MYNRYIPQETHYESTENGQERYREGAGEGYRAGGARGGSRAGFWKGKGGLGGILGGFGDGLGDGVVQTVRSLLKTFHLENIDIGDILLALIVLFLILEDGDDLDLIITLGLMILFSLGEQ